MSEKSLQRKNKVRKIYTKILQKKSKRKKKNKLQHDINKHTQYDGKLKKILHNYSNDSFINDSRSQSIKSNKRNDKGIHQCQLEKTLSIESSIEVDSFHLATKHIKKKYQPFPEDQYM